MGTLFVKVKTPAFGMIFWVSTLLVSAQVALNVASSASNLSAGTCGRFDLALESLVHHHDKHCGCQSGYRPGRHWGKCEEINECTEGTHDCHSDAACTNTQGNYTCACNQWYVGDGRHCSLPSSCSQILATHPGAGSGVYQLSLPGISSLVPVYCDMNFDGGGWTLILNYRRLVNTNPSPVALSTSLPLSRGFSLGVDDSGTANQQYWGHASNALLSKIPFTQMRWRGESTANGGVVTHFKTAHSNILQYARTGSGNADGLHIAGNHHLYGDHSSTFFQKSSYSYSSNFGDAALTEIPFYEMHRTHWSIRGQSHSSFASGKI